MSTVPTLHELDEAQARESTLFDSLARLVPEELQTAYYRVLAHTRTLSPDDEMLRILEAMGILALLTRHTPKDIADERERIQAMLDAHLQLSDEAQEKMLGYALRSLTLALQLEKAPAYERHIRPAIATQSRDLLLKLLNLDLQSHPPQAAILGVTLTAEAARPQTAQRGLFQAQFPEPDKLDILLARLRSIAGDHNVGAAELCNSHRDDEVTMTSFRPSVLTIGSSPSKSSCLALRRFRPAQPVRVSLKNGTPSLLFWQGGRLDLAEVKGPWQSSGYWWDGRIWEADEWDAVVVQPLYALRLRYERAPKAWTVAGVYD